MRLVNPRFVLRQWLLEEVIRRVERDSTSGKRVLAKVLHVCDLPYVSATEADWVFFRCLVILTRPGVLRVTNGLKES